MDVPFGDSEMAKLIVNKDWSSTPLGPIKQWPEALKTAASICLNSNFPIAIVWGLEYSLLYNNGYFPLCGDKHPQSMGQNFKECWASTWPALDVGFKQAFSGQASYSVNAQLFVDRFGYTEETFFTFSFTPIFGSSGAVEGLFIPVIETTEKMLSERRAHILMNVSAATSKAKTIEEIAHLSVDCLSQHHLDIPFALIYFFDESREKATLIASTGLNTEDAAHLKQVSLRNSHCETWPIFELYDKKIVILSDLDQRFGPLICAPYPEPIKHAVILPIRLAGQRRRHGALIFGVNTRRALDETYLSFYELLGASLTLAFNNSYLFEQEKKRAEALIELDRAKTLFFNNISHEFRTPLTLMLGPLEDILYEGMKKIPQEVRSDLGLVYRNCLRLLKLVNNLLDFSQLESQQMDAIFEPVSLSELTEDIASSFLPVIEKAGLQFIVKCDSIKNVVYVDKGMWEKIVLNLLSNAFKYTLKGSITLSLKAMARHVKLTVRDTGIGIPAEEVKNVFGRFHRVKGAQGRTHEGTGIGLALVNEMVKLHGGNIRVESRLNRGSAFIVSIPTGLAHLPAHQIREPMGQGAMCDNKYTKGFIEEALGLLCDDSISDVDIIKPIKNRGLERIVLVEDNADTRQYISNLLSEEYNVFSFVNGKEALLSIVENPPDIIISDVMMPVMDGLELTQQVRRSKEIASIPIILLSARAEHDAMISGISLGADDYLIKPFSAKELLVRIKQQFSMLHLRQESIKFKEEFLINLSHDLRSPLTSILGFTSLILNKKVGKITFKQQDFLTQVLNSANHVLALINDLLDTSKIEAGKIEFHPMLFNINDFVDEVAHSMAPLARDKNIKFVIKIDPQLSTVFQDPVRLKQIIYNFLSNAIKFSSVDGLVFIHLSPHEKDMFRIDVKDSGLGIKAEDIHLLFSKFAQLHLKAVNKQSGTGLGLFITKHLVEAQGGKVYVKSKPGLGSMFSAVLPRMMTTAQNDKNIP